MELQALLIFMLVGLLALYLLPVWFLVKFAKREHKDWRIALAAGLLFTWLFAWLIILIVPKLSDADHERINGKAEPEHRSLRVTGMKLPKPDFSDMGSDEWFKPVMWFLGVGSLFALGLMAWMQWLM